LYFFLLVLFMFVLAFAGKRATRGSYLAIAAAASVACFLALH